MTDPATHLPRHVRVVDYAAARATEVRPPAAADESLASLIHPHRVAFLLPAAADEDYTTHPAKPRLNTMATSVLAG